MILALRDPELRVSRPNWWRTNALSTKAGELLMITPFFIHSNLNPISGEYYSPGKAFDARVGTTLDIALIMLSGPVQAHIDATSGFGGTYLSARGTQWEVAQDAVKNIYKGPIKDAMGPGWNKTFTVIQRLPEPLKSIGMQGFKATNLAYYSRASKLYTYGGYASGFGKWEERIVRFFGGMIEYISGKGQ